MASESVDSHRAQSEGQPTALTADCRQVLTRYARPYPIQNLSPGDRVTSSELEELQYCLILCPNGGLSLRTMQSTPQGLGLVRTKPRTPHQGYPLLVRPSPHPVSACRGYGQGCRQTADCTPTRETLEGTVTYAHVG